MIVPKLIITIIPITYIIIVLLLWGIQKSISDSYYKYKDKGKWKYAFTVLCWSLAYPALLLSPTPLMFGAMILLGITGVSPTFKDDKYVKMSHMVGAYGGVGFSQLSISIDHHMFWQVTVPFIILSSILFIFRAKVNNNHIWWVEHLAILSIYIVLL